jgi:hypothetical protein
MLKSIFHKKKDDILSRTIKNISAASSSRGASMSPASTRSSSPVSFTTQQQQASSYNSSNKPGTSASNSALLGTRRLNRTVADSQHGCGTEKWTCMVCLSKHAAQIEVCSICGSSRSTMDTHHATPSTLFSPPSSTSQAASSITFTKHYNQQQGPNSTTATTFSAYLLNELGYNNSSSSKSRLKESMDSTGATLLSTTTSMDHLDSDELKSKLTSVAAAAAAISNPYIKKWTCMHCNFSNDSLKIVCLNCRWVKTHAGSQATTKSTMRMLNETTSATTTTTTPVKSHLINGMYLLPSPPFVFVQFINCALFKKARKKRRSHRARKRNKPRRHHRIYA